MRPTVLVAIMLLAVVLAGCTTTPAEAPDQETEDPILHTDPLETTALDAAEARNRSHLHDYWGGEHEILVAEDTVRMTCICGGGTAFRYEAPSGGIVPQGARWVNITVSWSVEPHSQFRDPTLWLETAADHEPWRVGPIDNGETIQIEVNNTQNDLPHETLSNWAYELHVSPPEGSAIYTLDGEATILVEAARGNPLPVFPPHPDLWNGSTEMLLFDQEDSAKPFYSGNPNNNAGGDWLGPHRPDNGTVVPYDMDHVVVTVTYGDDAPFPFTLGFHGAGTRDWILLGPDEVEGSTHTYILTAADDRPDGPYAVQSQWVFEVFADDEEPNAFIGSYTIAATAYQGPA